MLNPYLQEYTYMEIYIVQVIFIKYYELKKD